jgi:hypothetical protein
MGVCMGLQLHVLKKGGDVAYRLWNTMSDEYITDPVDETGLRQEWFVNQLRRLVQSDMRDLQEMLYLDPVKVKKWHREAPQSPPTLDPSTPSGAWLIERNRRLQFLWDILEPHLKEYFEKFPESLTLP